MSVRADADTLRRIPIFAECDAVPLQVIAFAAERQHFAAGETIVSEGARGLSAYLILNGRAEIRATIRSRQVSLGHADPGSLLGDMAMIGTIPYAVTASALTQVATARIDRSLFLRVTDAYPDFGAAVLDAMVRKLDGSLQDLNAVKGLFDGARSFSAGR